MNYCLFLVNSDTLAWCEVVEGIINKYKKTPCYWLAVSSDICKKENIFKWQPIDELTVEKLNELSFKDSLEISPQATPALQQAADHLHDASDHLPAYGCLVNVYLWPPKETESNDYTLLLGALRRLKDWHNASITLFDQDLSPDTEFLQKFLSAAVCFDKDKLEFRNSGDVLWRGKMSVCDKIENKGITVPGMTMTKLTQDTPDLMFPLKTPQQEETPCLLGRMLEVLDDVTLSSVPSIMMTGQTYKLCLYQKHPYAQVLMNYIQQDLQTGLLARLSVYPGIKKIPVCGDTNLSTSSWKENIMADIQFVQEPEEDYLDNYEFLYFIVTSPDKSSSMESFTAHAHLLYSPYQLNGEIVDIMYEQMLVKKPGVELELNIDKLPFINSESLSKVHDDLLIIQNSCLQEWIGERRKNNMSTVVSVSELNSCLLNIQQKFLEELASALPVHDESKKPSELNIAKIPTEAALNILEWPERQIQQYNESQRRSLSRIRSTESMPMSSPLQSCDTSKTVDIQDFLRYFSPDGSAAADNLSPIRRRHSSRAHTRVSQSDVSESSKVGWPESKTVQQHDIYYNTDRKSEKVNSHMNKLRDRFVKDDTSSSCTSSQVIFPKPAKQKQPGLDNAELRRSPRKKAPRSVFDENLPIPQKLGNISKSKVGRLSDSSTPLTSVQQNENRRRFSTSHVQSVSFTQPSSSHQLSLGRRRSEVSQSQSGTPLPRQVKKLRRESDLGSTPQTQVGKPESRSERHKRKLQEIVDKVLTDNGVSRDDPIFPSCSSRLFKVTKLFVMDLPTSRNLKEEMKKIAESQVKQVIEVDRTRRLSLDMKR